MPLLLLNSFSSSLPVCHFLPLTHAIPTDQCYFRLARLHIRNRTRFRRRRRALLRLRTFNAKKRTKNQKIQKTKPIFGARSVREIQAGLRSQLEQGLQMLLAGPEISSRLCLQLATRIDEVASRRQMHGSLRYRSAQELADRLVVRSRPFCGCTFSRLKRYRWALKLTLNLCGVQHFWCLVSCTPHKPMWIFRNVRAWGMGWGRGGANRPGCSGPRKPFILS